MRIYEGSPRQDFEEVFRSIGAFLDQRAMREVLLLEVPDGFVVQGLVSSTGGDSGWSEAIGHVGKETLTFLDDDIARFMDEGIARRKAAAASVAPTATAADVARAEWDRAGYYERAFRVLGRYLDEQKPRDVFFLEQDGAFVVRLLTGDQRGVHHSLAEFTRDDIEEMIAQGPNRRTPPTSTATKPTTAEPAAG